MAFPVSEEFLHYASGVFQPYPLEDFDKRIIYWHVVRLIGWGQAEDGSHYWTAINSFGEHWGDSAAAGVASDRACIKSNGTFQASLSEEDVLGCCAVCGNCYGGDPLKALVYWVNEGIVTGGRDGCRPYSFDRSCGVPCSPATFFAAEKNRICVRRCQDIYYQNKYDEDKHYASLAYSMYPRSMTVSSDGKVRAQVPTIIGHLNETSSTPMDLVQIRNILKKEISLFGPTTMAFPVSEEFLHYASGVFQPYTLEDFRQTKSSLDVGTFKINADWMEKYGLEYEAALV
ncbi:papain family cysteine protease [Ostertagia ostertagi]